jgi:hypothetical protein
LEAQALVILAMIASPSFLLRRNVAHATPLQATGDNNSRELRLCWVSYNEVLRRHFGTSLAPLSVCHICIFVANGHTRERPMTTALAPEQNLADTLGKLETALITPVIAGELSHWVAAVQEAASTLAMDLTTYLRTVLHVQYAEIAKTDPEMSAHVEKLLAGDRDIHQQLTSFHEELHQLAEAAAHVQRNEGKLVDRRQRVEEQGLALILNIKRQQAAATTWLAEAMFRDRGVKD